MCGIVGACLFGTQESNERVERVRILKHIFMEALLESESRGKDATGIALFFKDNWAVIKQPVIASDFVLEKDQEKDKLTSIMSDWKDNAENFISVLGHVRAGTKGSEYKPENNHPIIIGQGTDKQIIGIHNGVVGNDDEVFKKYKMKRIGEVDSEVIFQTLYHHSNGGENGITIEHMKKTMDDVQGSLVTLSVSNMRKFELVGMNSSGRPCEMFFIPEIQAAFIISERRFFRNAMETYERARIRGEFQRKLSYKDVNEQLSNKVYIIDTSKDVKDVKDLFHKVESANIYTTTTSTSSNTASTPEPASKGSSSSNSGSSKPSNVDSKTNYAGSLAGTQGNIYTGYSGAWPDDLSDWETSDNITEDNFSPAPPIQVRSEVVAGVEENKEGKEDIKENEEGIAQSSAEDDSKDSLDVEAVIEEGSSAEEVVDLKEYLEEFSGDYSWKELKELGEKVLDDILKDNKESTYRVLKHQISLLGEETCGTDKETINILNELIWKLKNSYLSGVYMKGVYISEDSARRLIEQVYSTAFAEGYAIGFRDGAEEQDLDTETDNLKEKLDETMKALTTSSENYEKVLKDKSHLVEALTVLLRKSVENGGTTTITTIKGIKEKLGAEMSKTKIKAIAALLRNYRENKGMETKK